MSKKLSVQTQFFLSHITITLLCILTFSSFFYFYVSNILMERQTDSLLSLTDSFLTSTDAALSTMNDVSLNFEYNQQVSPTCFPYITENISAQEIMSNLKNSFIAINGIDYKVVQMNVYDLSGTVFCIGSYQSQSQVDLSQQSWVAPTLANRGTKYIGIPYENALASAVPTSPTSYISTYHCLYDSFARHVGYVETIQTSKKVFQSILSYENSSNADHNTQIYVFNEDGALIYPYSDVSDSVLSLGEFYYENTTSNTDYLNVRNPLTNEKELMTYSHSPYSDFTFVCIQSERLILQPIITFTRILAILVIVILIFIFTASYFLSRNLTRPVHQLLQVFFNTQLETLGKEEQVDLKSSFNEFDQLNEAFYSMSSKLKDSMNILIETQQQELKSRSLALQSQINPHFYYNSLSSIMVLAENNQTPEIVHFAKNLTSMMRYITTGNMQVVTISSEISYVEKYLYCMKIRHQSSLHYTIDIDSTILDISIPKLLIQPLIENAVKYGMDCSPPWNIRVYTELTDTMWYIHVEDTGTGFTAESLEKLSETIKNADQSIGLPEMHIDGMGLLNVYLRWRLFHENNVFLFGNHPEGGARVTIGGKFESCEE